MATSKMKTVLVLLTSALMFMDGVSTSSLSSLIPSPLRIGAFNIQVLGKTKFGKPEIVEHIVKIIKRYDILLIQEIRDSSEKVIYDLQELVNEDLPSEEQYGMVVSERLGRSSSKEQYAFMYKETKVDVVHSYVFNDDNGDVFEREPYVVKFRTKADNFEFAMIGCHIKPSDAVNELNSMVKVYDDLLERYSPLEDAIFAGDFNADCSYLSNTKKNDVILRTDDRFLWLIDDDVDTTVAVSDCAYDRFIIAGEALARAYVPRSADVFYFDSAFGLTHEVAEDVSDHYPIELDLLPGYCSTSEEAGEYGKQGDTLKVDCSSSIRTSQSSIALVVTSGVTLLLSNLLCIISSI